jgi:uncharacterized DUF497 family protein
VSNDRPVARYAQCCYTSAVEEQGFDWDEANVEHLARHEVSPVEAEEAILDAAAILLEIQTEDEERFKSVGRTRGGRILAVVFTLRGDLIRAITAFDAPVREQEVY